MATSELDDHSRSIIHIDIDCFYAQVEMNKDPKLKEVPMGVRQKSFVVTSNHKAREFGVGKCISVAEAKKQCPNLTLVNGEDLRDYRQVSYKVTNLLHKFSPMVERLGLDENYVDVTKLVAEKLGKLQSGEVVGYVFGGASDKCGCGCTERLTVATVIAQDIRDLIYSELDLTTCAGIAHNKLLAKIVGSQNKPNKQTVIFPNSALELMLSLNSPGKIPGIGLTMQQHLESANIKTVQDLQNSSLKQLESLLGVDKAKTVYNYSYGIDSAPVKLSGKPQSIGLEDSYSSKSISIEEEVRTRLEQLLKRLLVLVSEDGRIPKTIKLTVRKYDRDSKLSNRETRQCNINPSLFSSLSSHNASKETKIMATVMHLFNRIIDAKKPYHITLLGLSFTKFQEPPNLRNSIASFLRKDLEVQSVISIESEACSDCSRSPKPSTSSALLREMESPTPSPKKLKLGNLVTKKRCFEDFYEDCESPSKLKVADLSLDSVACPPDVDQEVFKELPREVQKEIWEDYRRRKQEMGFCGSQVKKAKPNTLLNYFIRN